MTNKLLILIISLTFTACQLADQTTEASKDEFYKALQAHLEGIKNADIDAVKATLPTEGSLYWVKTNGTKVSQITDFVNPHIEWFENFPVHMDYTIDHYDAGTLYGYAGVSMCYYSDESKSQPGDSVQVSYVLQRFEEGWKVVSDHATFVEVNNN